MNKLVRYGRKIPMPSTAEIKHELRLMAAGDTLTQSASGSDVDQIVEDLSSQHGISNDRAWMLVNRFGIGHSTLETAAADLPASKASHPD